MTNKIVAKSVILNEEGRILLLRRSKSDPRRPGEYDFPGGGVDHGEDLAEAAARELHEEAGLDVEPGELTLVYAATQLYTDKQESVTRLLFVARVANNAVKLSFEHDEYQWQPAEQALALFPHPFYGTGLRYAVEHNLLD